MRKLRVLLSRLHARRWALLEYNGHGYVIHSRHWTRLRAELARMDYAVNAPAAGCSPLLLGRVR